MKKLPLRQDLAERVVRDINHILKQGWAEEVSRQDFYHGHVCTTSEELGNPKRIGGGATRQDELDGKRVVLLYHTHELDGKAYLPYRNIASYRDSELPVTIMPQLAGAYARTRFGDDSSLERERQAFGIITVTSLDLGLDEWFDFVFDYSPNGGYMLENGRRIDISAELFKHEMEIMIRDFMKSLTDGRLVNTRSRNDKSI